MQANKMRQFQLISNPSPPVRWAGMLILLATLTHLAASLRANSGITDPWGENQRPKLYTDYLTQHSGKNWIVFTYILKKNLCTCSKYTSVIKSTIYEQFGERLYSLALHNLAFGVLLATQFRFLQYELMLSNWFLIGLEFTWEWIDENRIQFKKSDYFKKCF